MCVVLETTLIRHHNGVVLVAEVGVEVPMDPVRTQHGKIGRDGINETRQDRRNRDMFRTLLSWH